MARCLIGCGSNVGSRHDFLDRALELLRFMPGVALTDVSRYRDTRPIGGPPDQDVFLNAVGGVKITEPAADLAVLLAIHSSMRNKALPKGLIVFGEVGLAGEIRPSPRGQERPAD